AKQLGSCARMNVTHARQEAKTFLNNINNTKLKPDTAVTLGDFVDMVYFPQVERNLRPSTLWGYHVIWNDQLKSHCARLWLREVRTSHMQTLLNSLASDIRFGTNSIKHMKSFLSGVFKLAIQLDYYGNTFNPLQQASIPKSRPADETYAYSLEEIDEMLAVVPEPGATAIATAAYTGARRGEICGMSWENYNRGEMMIATSVWAGHVTEPKNQKSKAPIPIIKCLGNRLDLHRMRLGNPERGPVFPNAAGRHADLNNMLFRLILPVLNRCEVCKEPELVHGADVDHKYKRDASLPEWHGWHAFRRGLATNLYRLGVPDKTIQAILRHADVNTTMKCYVKTTRPDVKAGMEKFEADLENRLLDSNRTVKATLTASERPV
ncbi:MAG: site-specific integrase, partial [Terriglobales bacterium]